ncbi:MAG TPA: hypothetical protein VF702_06810 [Allosphingosinicella sp.]|jgi:hypothetical protein
MPETVDKDIVVKGSRPKPHVQLGEGSGGGSFAPFIPMFIASAEWQHGIGGGDAPVRVRMIQDGENVIFVFEDIGIRIRIPLVEWNDMSDPQRRTMTYVFQHYDQSDRLVAALTHYAREGVAEIIVRFDTRSHQTDGTSVEFNRYSNGSIAGATVDSDWNTSDITKTDLLPGSTIVISINSAHPANDIMYVFAKTIIHELLHPWVPETLQRDGTMGDEDQLQGPDRAGGIVDEEYKDIFDVAPDKIGPGAEVGVAYLGSRGSDNDVGTLGNDVMAGMEGNDVLNGMGGADLLAGGTGMDRLIAGTGFSDLRGGLDADTYVASQPDANFYLEDTGGVDRLVVSGSSAQLLVTRNGNNLSIWSSSDPFAYEIVDHYVDGKRIEIFQFSDAEYSASYLEYLAESAGGGPGVCYQDGYPVICGNYGMPVVIDLGGDGVRLVEVNKSRVRWDVDGDGKAERVGWTDGEDAFLVLDRNGNGTIDSFSELSFLSDFRGAGSDLEGLLAYDDNGDGFISEADEIYSRLQLWLDANTDGVSQPHELVSLASAGILSIGLEIRDLRKLDQSEPTNQVLGWSEVSMSDGKVLKAFDVGFYYKSRDDEWRMTSARDSQPAYEPHEILVADLVI